MSIDGGADQILHKVWRIASEWWIRAAEREVREVVGKFGGFAWMVKDIRTSKVPGRRK